MAVVIPNRNRPIFNANKLYNTAISSGEPDTGQVLVFDGQEYIPTDIATEVELGSHISLSGYVHGILNTADLALKSGTLTQFSNYSHTILTDIGTNTHAVIDNHIAGTGTSVHGDSFLLNTGDSGTGAYTLTNASGVPLTLNNGAGANNIFVAQDNGSAVFTIADGGNVGIGTTPVQKLHINSGHIRFEPITSPTVPTATLAGVGAGNLGNGVYTYGVSFVTSDNQETNVGSTTTVTVVDNTVNGQVNLTNIPISPDPRVTKRKIHRTAVNAGAWNIKYLGVINDNTTTTFGPDNVADGGLGATTAYQDNTTAGIMYKGASPMLRIGEYNTAMGIQSGSALTSGGLNTFFGFQAGNKVTTGSINTLIGRAAGLNLTTGGWNVAIGDAMENCGTGAYNNVAIGVYAGNSVTSGQNVFVGQGAGQNLTGGYSNVMVGYYAGQAANTAVYENIYIGCTAGRYETGSRKLMIDSSTRANEATARAEAILYGIMSPTVTDQQLNINARTTIASAGGVPLTLNNGAGANSIFVAQDNGTAVFTIGDGGKVGIGTAPTSSLIRAASVYSNASGTSYGTNITLSRTGGARTDGGDDAVLFFSGYYSSASNGWAYGVTGQISIDAAVALTNVAGLDGNVTGTSTGSCTLALGARGRVTLATGMSATTAYGVYGNVTGVGTVTTVGAVDGNVTPASGASFTTVRGVRGRVTVAAGATVTTAYALYGAITNSGTLDTSYGLYLEALGGTTKYGIYQAGTESNYFAGNIGIGTVPSYLLHLSSTNTATSSVQYQNYNDYIVNPGSASTATYRAVYIQTRSSSGNISGATLEGFIAQVRTTGTGNIGTIKGCTLIADNVSSGTVSSAYGATTQIQPEAGAITNAYNLYMLAPYSGGTGTLGTIYGLYVANQGISTRTTNVYGIYLAAQSGGATNNYSVYTNAGLVHFGDSVDLASGKNITLVAGNIITDTTTGTKIGTATNQKIGFFNATPVVQQAYTAVSNPPTQAEVTAIRDALVNLGLMAAS